MASMKKHAQTCDLWDLQVAVTASYAVFTWGAGAKGQLGPLGGKDGLTRPRQMLNLGTVCFYMMRCLALCVMCRYVGIRYASRFLRACMYAHECVHKFLHKHTHTHMQTLRSGWHSHQRCGLRRFHDAFLDSKRRKHLGKPHERSQIRVRVCCLCPRLCVSAQPPAHCKAH